MTDMQTVMDSILTAIQESGRMPSSMSYSTWELDAEGGQSNVRTPVIEITPINTVRSRPHNTDFIDFATNQNGEQIGYIFRGKFEMPLQIDIWTQEGSKYSPRELGGKLKMALYEYDDLQLGRPLPDPNNPSQSANDIDRFIIEDGEPANDLTMTPSLRRWRHNLEVWFSEYINTAEEYGAETPIRTVKSGSGDVIASTNKSDVTEMKVDSVTSNGMILYDATPNTDSSADNY